MLLAGLLHLGIVLLIYLHDPPRTGQGSGSPPHGRLERWANPVLILLSLAFLAVTVRRGGIQDYFFYLQMWQRFS